MTPSNVEHSAPPPSLLEDMDADESFQEGDLSTVTVAGKQGCQVFPDFVILKVFASHHIRKTDTTLYARYGARRITDCRISIIVEIKRNVSRSASSDTYWQIRFYGKRATATKQVLDQAKHAFVANSAINTIVLIAAVGNWWSRSTVNRDMWTPAHYQNAKFVNPADALPTSYAIDAVIWTDPVKLNSKASNQAFRDLHIYLGMTNTADYA